MALILFLWVILTILSIVGRRGAYRSYSTGHGFSPGVLFVMQGIHDHVMPWSAPPSGPALAPEDGTTLSADAQTKAGAQAPGAEDGAEQAVPQDDPQTPGAGDKEKAAVKEDAAEKSGSEGGAADAEEGSLAKEDGKQDAFGEEPENTAKADGGQGAEKEASEKNSEKDSEKDAPDEVSEKQGQAPEAEKEDAEDGADKKEQKDENAGEGEKEDGALKTASVFRIPETSCSRVVAAKDYGVAKREYLSDEGTHYNTDTEGLFAPNGIYYPLGEVEDSYFSDALFIGDSRTVGLFEYGGMEEITSFMARESTTIYDLFDDNERMDYTPKNKMTTERTLGDLLSKAKFKKIYLSVGVNELGVPDTEDYYREYRKVLKRIHKLQPDALLYVQGIMHVSKAMSRSDPVYNNTAIVQRNQAIATLANGRSIFYIDMNADLCDEDGNLRDDLTGDGIHLKASACGLWHEFLRKNAVVLPKE